jgi:hypothetical protein
VKGVFTEQWDDYQLAAVSSVYGGNKNFFLYLQDFNISSLPIADKYTHKAVKYYVRRLTALVEGKDFTELPPAKDWSERLNRVTSKVIKATNVVEKNIIEVGEKLDNTIEEKGWADKVKGFFKRRLSKDPIKKESNHIQYQEVVESDQ